jgi:hypothetical protein
MDADAACIVRGQGSVYKHEGDVGVLFRQRYQSG